LQAVLIEADRRNRWLWWKVRKRLDKNIGDEVEVTIAKR